MVATGNGGEVPLVRLEAEFWVSNYWNVNFKTCQVSIYLDTGISYSRVNLNSFNIKKNQNNISASKTI